MLDEEISINKELTAEKAQLEERLTALQVHHLVVNAHIACT